MAIEFEVSDGIATITMNRPERLNALDAEHYRALSQAWERVRDDAQIRVAIITGAGGKAFSTGADLKTHIPNPAPLDEMWLTQREALLNRGLQVWKPVISAVDGYCVGGGLTLMLATDIRIATPQSRFGLSEVTRGVIAANGGTQRLIAQIPYAIAMEHLLTGALMDSASAERWGLINRVVPAESLRDAAHEYAARLAANAPLAVQASKELAIRSRDLGLEAGLRLEQVTARLLKDSDDAGEGTAAFAERRQPAFKGR